jgi:hypothetical protein
MESIATLLTTGCFLLGQAAAAAATIVSKSEEMETLKVGLGQGVPGGQEGRPQGRQTRIGGRLKGKRARWRVCCSIAKIHETLGPQYFCRAYRMTYASFCHLHELLRDRIDEAVAKKRSQHINHNFTLRRPPIPNGRIHTTICLGCALQYFAGGHLMIWWSNSESRTPRSWIVYGLSSKPSTSTKSSSLNIQLTTRNKNNSLCFPECK